MLYGDKKKPVHILFLRFWFLKIIEIIVSYFECYGPREELMALPPAFKIVTGSRARMTKTQCIAITFRPGA